MYKFLTKYGQILAFGLGFVLVLIYIITISGNLPEGFNQLEPKDQIATGTSAFDFGLMISIILVILTIVVILAFMVVHFIGNPKGAIKGLVGVVALIAIFFITYSMADPSLPSKFSVDKITEYGLTPGVSQYVGGAITATGILGVLAILAIVVTEIHNAFK